MSENFDVTATPSADATAQSHGGTLAKLWAKHRPHFSWLTWMPILSKRHPRKRTLVNEAGLPEPINPSGRMKQRIDDHSGPGFHRCQAGAHKRLRDKFTWRIDGTDLIEVKPVAPEAVTLNSC